MQVGDKVFVALTGNRARNITSFEHFLERVREDEVVKIGSKYFYLGNCRENKFSIQTLKAIDNVCSNYRVYLSMQDIYDEHEFNELHNLIRKFFDVYNGLPLSLDQLRRIKAIIDEEQNE
jgi:hypothetical protein